MDHAMAGSRWESDALVERVLVIDDHPLFCEALTMTLKDSLAVGTVYTASCLQEGLDQIHDKLDPQAVLLDLNLPDVDGVDGLIRLKTVIPDVPIIVVSSISDNRIISSVMRAGAAGFVRKDSPREVLLTAFREVMSGQQYTPPDFMPSHDGDLSESAEDQALERLADLTNQQARILQLICEGKLNKQIAYDLSIAETTVKAHITAILRKLGVHSRTQAVLVAQKARFSTILHDTRADE